jgi:hypothetical protein
MASEAFWRTVPRRRDRLRFRGVCAHGAFPFGGILAEALNLRSAARQMSISAITGRKGCECAIRKRSADACDTRERMPCVDAADPYRPDVVNRLPPTTPGSMTRGPSAAANPRRLCTAALGLGPGQSWLVEAPGRYPELFGLVRGLAVPEPGTTPIGSASSIRSLRLNGAALRSRFRPDLSARSSSSVGVERHISDIGTAVGAPRCGPSLRLPTGHILRQFITHFHPDTSDC